MSWAGWAGARVLVAGAGLSGAAAARALRDRGAAVTVAARQGQVDDLAVADLTEPPPGTDLVVTSPGWRPDHPLLVAARHQGIEVYGEVELAWRLAREPGSPPPAPWLAVTGTNGKTTTVRLLAGMLGAAGHRVVAAGNVGLPLVAAVLAEPAYDVLAVELSSFQLHWSPSVRPRAAAVLNIAPDHLDWHGSFAAYAAAKAGIWRGPVSIGNLDDEMTRSLLPAAAGRQVGFTLAVPAAGELGVRDGVLVDRAFADAPDGEELAAVSDLAVPGAHNLSDALGAAALARAHGAPGSAVREGLRGFHPDPHRQAVVAERDGVQWVDDSKATNPHAAAASLADHQRVVWIAGGLLKGADVEDLVRGAAPRLAGAVLLGTDRAALREALARHAPDLPVAEVSRLDTGAMSEAVAAARRLAVPGDTVLLAPAAASMDCFRDYAERGELFAAQVRA